MRSWTAAAIVLIGAASAQAQAPSPSPAAAGQSKIIDVRSAQAPAGTSFTGLWESYLAAQQRGDAEGAQNVIKEIRRLRIERNIVSLGNVALARVAEGVDRLQAGERSQAEEAFRGAIALDPHLPDAHFGLALAQVKRGPLGLVGAAKETVLGLVARLPTARGRTLLLNVLVPAGLLALFATVCIVAVTFVLRHGTLLLHDIEEGIGPARGRALPLATFLLLLLLPLILFQGWGWLPLWWMVLLFVYLGPVEKGVAVAVTLAALAVGPAVEGVDGRLRANENPVYRGALVAVSDGPDDRAMLDLERSVRENPEDVDLVYLLASLYKKSGRYEDAAALYRERLRKEPTDDIALNNLGNLDFAAGEFQNAITRYKQALEANPKAHAAATLFYNLSLAQYQKFEYQPAQESRSQADRIDAALVSEYDTLWKYDSGLSAVVDLGLSEAEITSKFAGGAAGAGVKNVSRRAAPAAGFEPATLLNRFSAMPVFLLLVVPALLRWRGKRAFTMRCGKCGTPFCKLCHLGAASEGLCTQCHHLFVVRDGVSGPARNQKLLEVQKEESRRERVYRALSLLAPGAGHVFARRTVAGLVLLLLWSSIVALTALAGRLLPLTEASSMLLQPFGLWLAGLLLLVLYVVANRARPDFDTAILPARRGGAAAPRRARAS